MRPETTKRLADALAACEAIATFTQGLDFGGYSSSTLVRSAVERQFEIIGEAPGRVVRDDASMVRTVPEIRRIVGLRNRLIHGYDSVDDQIVWDLVKTKLPVLSADLRRQLMPKT
ncbi:MAG: DUF86 domain-containing protein [Opitutaceae bacterium]|nr:DUF86 domain-containing protein [Opitutaceae bacterium]